jgi:hypothetical protein
LILKDEALMIEFFTLTSFCSLITLHEVGPLLRGALVKHLGEYNRHGGKGGVLAAITTSKDRFMLSDADVSVSLQNNSSESKVQAAADIVMSDFYGFTYLLFKHATQMQRRIMLLQENYLYRVFLVAVMQLYGFLVSGLSSDPVFPDSFIGFFIGISTPFGLCYASIFHSNYGYNVFHRIYGEYKANMILDFWDKTIGIQIVFKAILDACAICAVSFIRAFSNKESDFYYMPDSDGKFAGMQARTFYFSLTFAFAMYSRMRDVNFIGPEREIASFLTFIVSLLILIGSSSSTRLEGLTQFGNCPALFMQFVFVCICY